MRLHEYHAKTLFSRFAIPILTGELASTPSQARAAAERLRLPVVINAQILANKRVFQSARTLHEVQEIAESLLGSTIDGYAVNHLLIEPHLEVAHEYALSIEFNRARGIISVEASNANGRLTCAEDIDPLVGIHAYKARYLASGIDLSSDHWGQFVTITRNLYRCYSECDATRIEIHPLALTKSHTLIALGGKIDIDDNALFRQPELAAMRDVLAEDELPSRTLHDSMRFMRLPGDIACIANGAGLAMATADALVQHNPLLCPGAVIEFDGEPTLERFQTALRSLPSNTRGIIINLYCYRYSALSAVDTLQQLFSIIRPKIPLVARLAGLDAERAQARLAAANNFSPLTSVTSVSQAAEFLSFALADGVKWQS